jgi:hypothetical protein
MNVKLSGVPYTTRALFGCSMNLNCVFLMSLC